MSGQTNPRPWRGRCRAGFSNTGGHASLASKEGTFYKKEYMKRYESYIELNMLLLLARNHYSLLLKAYKIRYLSTVGT